MKIDSLVPQAISRNIAGLVHETEGLKSLGFNTVNLQNSDTLVFVDLIFIDGTERRVFCSKAVSAGIRSKEISRSNLMSFPIVPFEHNDGDVRYYIQMPQSTSNRVTTDVASLTVTNYVRKTTAVSLNDLIAL